MKDMDLDNLETCDNTYWIESYNALLRLQDNPDFQKVIVEGFLTKKALGAVSLLADPAIKKRGERTDVMEELIAISSLSQYLYTVIPNLAGSARVDMVDENIPKGAKI